LLAVLFLAGATILSNPAHAQEAALPPDDSEHIIFIIDTSGSMFNHVWPLMLHAGDRGKSPLRRARRCHLELTRTRR
jgi:hypothetical protein